MENVLDGGEVVLATALDGSQRATALEGPGDDVQTGGRGGHAVVGRHDGVVVRSADGEKHWNGRADDVDALRLEPGEVAGRRSEELGGVFFVEEDGLLAKGVVVFQPEQDVVDQEGLRPDAVWRDGAVLESVNEVLGVLLLCVAVEWHWHLWWWSLELRGEVAETWNGLDKVNIRVQSHDSAAGVVELGAPIGCAVLVVLDVFGAGVEAVLLAAEGGVLSSCDIAGAAEGVCWRGTVGWSEWDGTLRGERRVEEDVGSGVEITEGVTADESSVGGERYITFEDTGAHASTGLL